MQTETSIQKYEFNFSEIQLVARAMAESKFFADASQEAQAIVKILAGQEIGIGPFASMAGVHIIKGKPTMGGNLMAAAIKKSRKYDYKVVEFTAEKCAIEFYENGNLAGISEFSMKDAQTAGLTANDNWRKYPRNMLFNRAISNGTRWFTPDIFGGAAIYTPDEMGANVDDSGDIILDAQFNPTEKPRFAGGPARPIVAATGPVPLEITNGTTNGTPSGRAEYLAAIEQLGAALWPNGRFAQMETELKSALKTPKKMYEFMQARWESIQTDSTALVDHFQKGWKTAQPAISDALGAALANLPVDFDFTNLIAPAADIAAQIVNDSLPPNSGPVEMGAMIIAGMPDDVFEN